MKGYIFLKAYLMAIVLGGKFPFLHRISTGTGASGGNTDMMTWDYWYNGSSYNSSTAGINVTSTTALKLSAYWRAINLLSSQIAGFPIGLFKRLPNGDTEQITDHPSVKLLKLRPNNIMNPLVWRESMQASALIHGNGYSLIERTSTGVPTALKMLDATQVDPRTDGNSLVYKCGNMGGYDSYYILHIPSLIFDGIKGKAILEAAAESMGVALAMQKYSADTYQNGAKQSGVLTHPLQLSDTAVDGVRRSFNKKIKDKDGGVMVLDEGMKFQPLSMPPDQQQLIQSKQFSVQDMARWFGIPPYLLFEESRSTFTNIESQGLEFVRYTLTQWVTRWEAELKIKLLTADEQQDHFYKMNMGSLLRGDLKSRYEAYGIGIEKGWLNPNEVRGLEDLNKIPGGDIYTQQINKEPLGNTKKDGETNTI